MTTQEEEKIIENVVETIGVKSRIPPLWRDNVRLWIAHFETMVATLKLGDENKFGLAVAQLDKCDIEQISDILMGPPIGRYEKLKERLLSIYEVSENKRIKKLLNEMELGDQLPSQLLRRMKDLARDNMPDKTLRLLWMGHLPAATRAVLAISEETLELQALAAIADKMHEQSKEVNVLCSCKEQPARSDAGIIEAIEELRKEVAQLKWDRSRSSERSQYRQRRGFRGRSRSPTPQYKKNSSPVCYFHRRFGKKAYRCRSPCNFKNNSEN